MDAFWVKAYLAVGFAFVGVCLYIPGTVKVQSEGVSERTIYAIVSLICFWVVLTWPYWATQAVLKTIFVKKN